MDIVSSQASVETDASTLQSLYCDQEQLLLTLRQAAERANQLDREIVASFTQPTHAYDPLHIFRAFTQLQQGNSLFWACPSEQQALVGTGTTLSIETSGPTRAATTTGWRELQEHAVVGKADGTTPVQTDGPVLFGGFAFDPLNEHTALWQDFPDGLLILPQLLFHRREDVAALTINLLVQPTTNIEQLAEETAINIQRLNTSMESCIAPSQEIASTPQKHIVRDLLAPSVWKELVTQAVQTIRHDAFEKVVLARGIEITQPERPFDIAQTLDCLCESYPGSYVFAIQQGKHYFVGATPERLVCGADGQIQTVALAGSAPRGATEEEDQRFGRDLLSSAKNQSEHHVVVTTIRSALTALCSRVWVADAPHLLKLRNIQHLQTPLTGDLLPGHSILEAIEDLHPTPAVGGHPRQHALAFIRANERLDRGWYAGPIGWVGTSGNGEFAVALRSALIEGNRATLFAGCGIVADSDPESEYAESCLKLQVMLRGLLQYPQTGRRNEEKPMPPPTPTGERNGTTKIPNRSSDFTAGEDE